MADVQIKVDILPQITKEAIQGAVNAAASGLKLNISGVQIDSSGINTSLQSAFSNAQKGVKIKPDFDLSGLTSGAQKQMSSMESLFKSTLTKAMKNGNTSRVNELTASYDKMIAKIENASKISSSGARNGAEAAKKEFASLLSQATKTDEAAKKLSNTMRTLENSANKVTGKSANTAKVSELNSLLERTKTNINGLGNATAKESSVLEGAINRDVQAIRQLIKELELESKASQDAAKAQQTLTKSSTLSNNIESWMQKNSKAAERYGTQLRKLQTQLRGNTDAGTLKNVSLEFQNIKSQAQAAGLTVNSFTQSIRRVGFAVMGISGTYMAIRKVVDTIKRGINTVKELDDALVDLKKTTTMNDTELNQFYLDANNSAKQYGVTTKDVIQSAANWSRLGYSDKSSAETMANLSSMMSVISPGMSVDQATTGLVSVMKAYGFEADEVLDGIMSKINIVGNTAATSNDQIITGLERSASAVAMMNTNLDKSASLEQNIALFTAGQEIIQDASKVGNAIRTISMRIRSYDEETEQFSEDLANISGEVIDLTKTAKKPEGISLFTDATQTQYKDIGTYLHEISEIYDDLGAKQQQTLLEKLFGKNRASVGAAILSNMDAYDEAIANMENSAGNAEAEMSIASESISFHLNALKETWVGVAQSLFDRGTLNGIVDGLTLISNGIKFIVDNLGLLGTIGAGAGIVALVKNLD